MKMYTCSTYFRGNFFLFVFDFTLKGRDVTVGVAMICLNLVVLGERRDIVQKRKCLNVDGVSRTVNI